MDNIYSVVDLSHFSFTNRARPFDWRRLHGVDVDETVRLNDTAALEAIIPTLQHGSLDAEPSLSAQNYIQLFRLVQLAVEHLWQMRESHTKRFSAHVQSHTAAESWKAAATAYLEVAGQLLAELNSEQGALLTEQLVAAARETLERADSSYNAALDRLEAEDAAARCHRLRRERLDISWRLVFGVDVQRLVMVGDVIQLEQLLPQVAYGNIMSEDPAALTSRHFRQLLLLGQACLDYLWAICMATSRVMEQQVQQLATTSAPIPQLTTATEEVKAALATARKRSSKSVQRPAAQHSVHTAHTAAAASSKQQHTANSNHISSSKQDRVALQNNHGWPQQDNQTLHTADGPVTRSAAPPAAPSQQQQQQQHDQQTQQWSRRVVDRTFLAGFAPAAGTFRAKVNQLDSDLRLERERTEAMRRALEEATDMLKQLPSPIQQQQEPPALPPQPVYQPQPQLQLQQRQQYLQQPPYQPAVQQQQPLPASVQIPATVYTSLDRQPMQAEHAQYPVPWPESPSAGGVRVVINEDTIRAQERQAAGEQLRGHIDNIINTHKLSRQFRHSHSRQLSKAPSISFSSVSAVDRMSGGRDSRRQTSVRSARYSREYPGAAVLGHAAGLGDVMSSRSPSPTAAAHAVLVAALQQQQQELMQNGYTGVVPPLRDGVSPSQHATHPRSATLEDFRLSLTATQAAEAATAAANGVEGLTHDHTAFDHHLAAAAAAVAAQAAAAAVARSSRSSAAPAHAAATVLRQAETPMPKQSSGSELQQQQMPARAVSGFQRAKEAGLNLIRSVSPKRMLSSSGGGSKANQAVNSTDTAVSGIAASHGGSSNLAALAGLTRSESPAVSSPPNGSSPVITHAGGSPLEMKSGKSFTSRVAGKVAAEVAAMVAPLGRPLTPTEAAQLSPLKANIVAYSGHGEEFGGRMVVAVQ